MKLAIIGAGSVGGTLGKAWQRRGHDVTYGVRNPDDPKYGSLGAFSNADAVNGADVVVLCTPWHGTRDAVATCGDLTLARLLEPYGLIWIHLALRRGFGTSWGFGLLRSDT
jgi:prephenate dehydrogenase